MTPHKEQTPTEKVQESLGEQFPLISIGRLEYVETKVSGTHILHVLPDRRVRQFGVLWAKEAV